MSLSSFLPFYSLWLIHSITHPLNTSLLDLHNAVHLSYPLAIKFFFNLINNNEHCTLNRKCFSYLFHQIHLFCHLITIITYLIISGSLNLDTWLICLHLEICASIQIIKSPSSDLLRISPVVDLITYFVLIHEAS